MSTTDAGVPDVTVTEPLDDSSSEAAFLSRWFPEGDPDDASKKKPLPEVEDKKTPKTKEPKADEETSEDDETPPEETETTEGDEGDEEETSEKAYVDNDETFVKVKVGDAEHEVPVKDLKRLFGQEAALTQKSQEVATKRKEVDAQAQTNSATLDALVKRATTKADQFRNLDFVIMSRDPNISTEELTALRTMQTEALDEERFLKSEQGNFKKELDARQRTVMVEQATACKASLTTADSPNYIEGFDQKIYDNIRTFAISEGVAADMVHSLTDPAAIKIIHMASLYKKGLSKVVTTKVNKTVKKVIKTSTSPKTSGTPTNKAASAMKKLQSSGSDEDATNAFMARWDDAASA